MKILRDKNDYTVIKIFKDTQRVSLSDALYLNGLPYDETLNIDNCDLIENVFDYPSIDPKEYTGYRWFKGIWTKKERKL